MERTLGCKCLLTAVCVKAESGPTSIVMVFPPASSLISNLPALAVLLAVAFASAVSLEVKFPKALFCGNGVAFGKDQACEHAKALHRRRK